MLFYGLTPTARVTCPPEGAFHQYVVRVSHDQIGSCRTKLQATVVGEMDVVRISPRIKHLTVFANVPENKKNDFLGILAGQRFRNGGVATTRIGTEQSEVFGNRSRDGHSVEFCGG